MDHKAAQFLFVLCSTFCLGYFIQMWWIPSIISTFILLRAQDIAPKENFLICGSAVALAWSFGILLGGGLSTAMVNENAYNSLTENFSPIPIELLVIVAAGFLGGISAYGASFFKNLLKAGN